MSSLRELADDAGRDKIVKAPKKGLPRILNHEFVDSLGLYVHDLVTLRMMPDNNFARDSYYRFKLSLQEENISMLTPAQFWKYYDFCDKKRPDLKKIFDIEGTRWGEWLDALVHKDNMIVNPLIKGTANKPIVSAGSGKPLHDQNLPTISGSKFSLDDINPKSGLPTKPLKYPGDGDWTYYIEKVKDRFLWVKKNPLKNIAVTDILNSNEPVGVRYCYTPEVALDRLERRGLHYG